MRTVGPIAGWCFLIALFATGAYSVWHSTTAAEFTARETLTGRAKYHYRPKRYHRTLHFAVSLLFLLLEVFGSIGGASEIIHCSCR